MSKPLLMQMSTGYTAFKNTIDRDFKTVTKNITENAQLTNAKYKVLIFPTRVDDEITLLGPSLLSKNIDYLRVNVEDFLDNFTFNMGPDNLDEFDVSFKNVIWNSSEIDLVWFRHFDLSFLKLGGADDDEINRVLQAQWKIIFDFISNKFRGKVIGAQEMFDRWNKLYQLMVAHDNGCAMIESLISNDDCSIKNKFLKNKTSFTKSVNHHFVSVGQNKCLEIYGGMVPSEGDKNSLLEMPAIYQKKHANITEVRVTLIGEHVFAAKIINDIVEDWHKENIEDIKLEEVPLLNNIKEQINYWKSRITEPFMAIDYIVTANDDWLFLEINLKGDWSWVEGRTDFPITNAVSETIERLLRSIKMLM